MASRIVLSFGGRSEQVLLETGAGLAKLQEIAEAELALFPDSYNFYDSCGKVEIHNLQRVLLMARDGPCRLEVREKAEWKKIREMEARLDAMEAAKRDAETTTATTSVATVPAAAIEDQVQSAVAQALKTLEAKDADLQAKVDGLDLEGLRSRLDSLQDCLGPSACWSLPALDGAFTVASADTQHVPSAISACALDTAVEAAASVADVGGSAEVDMAAVQRVQENLQAFQAAVREMGLEERGQRVPRRSSARSGASASLLPELAVPPYVGFKAPGGKAWVRGSRVGLEGKVTKHEAIGGVASFARPGQRRPLPGSLSTPLLPPVL